MTITEKTVKREPILKAAEELFAKQGFDGTSVRDIAQLANVNLAMINYYFGSKEKLLAALIDDRSGYTVGILEQLSLDQTLEPMAKMDKLVDFYAEKILNNSRFHSILQQEFNSGRSTAIKEQIMNLKLRNLEHIKKIIGDGQRKKMFRKVDLELTMASVMGTLSQCTNSRHFYCALLKIDESDEEAYRKKVIPRMKTHLKQLLHAHLDIKNEE
jgi:AcrR family transcriptional regulator